MLRRSVLEKERTISDLIFKIAELKKEIQAGSPIHDGMEELRIPAEWEARESREYQEINHEGNEESTK